MTEVSRIVKEVKPSVLTHEYHTVSQALPVVSVLAESNLIKFAERDPSLQPPSKRSHRIIHCP